jgi:hypothetical protein
MVETNDKRTLCRRSLKEYAHSVFPLAEGAKEERK